MRNGKFLAMEVGVLAIVAPLTVSALHPLWLRAQSAAPAVVSQAFEVASVKPNKSGDGRIFFQIQPGGRFTATNVPVRELIRMAYGIQTFQLVGGPDDRAALREVLNVLIYGEDKDGDGIPDPPDNTSTAFGQDDAEFNISTPTVNSPRCRRPCRCCGRCPSRSRSCISPVACG